MSRDDWVETVIDNVCTRPQYGYTTRGSQQGDIRLLRTTDITSGRINWNTVPFCQVNPKDPEKYLLKDGDIVISRAGSIGVSYLIEIPELSVFASYLIRFNPLIDRKYFKYFLNSPYYWSCISENKLGIAVPNVNATKIKNISISIAPLPEQRAIVAKIEQLFSDLDNGIENLKTAQEQLKVYRQAVLKKAFEGELTKGWRALRQAQGPLPSADELLGKIKEERAAHYQKQVDDWEQTVREWEENGKKGKKPSKSKKVKELSLLMKEDFIELPVLPDEWVWIKSENVHGFITKGTTPKKNELFSNRGEIPFIKVYNLTFNGSLDFTINPTFVSEETHNGFLNRSIVYPNDVLMNIVGPPLGKVSIVPTTYPEWNINQAIARFRPYKILLSKYLALFLSSKHTIHRVSKMAKATAGQFNLTLEICRNISIPICSFSEQTQIVQEIESRLSVCDKVEETIKDSLKKAEALRQSILKKAFEGLLLSKVELDACRKEADWEPAEVLLERIKRERSK